MKSLKVLIQKNGLPEKAAYFLLGVFFGLDLEVLQLQKSHIQKLFKLGLLYFENGALKSKINVENIETVELKSENDITKFRKLFKGLKPGSMGDSNSVYEKMKRWRTLYPEYSWEQILFKTEKFIDYKKSLNEEKYIPQADYFIFKKVGLEEKSMLASIIEEDFETEEIFGYDVS